MAAVIRIDGQKAKLLPSPPTRDDWRWRLYKARLIQKEGRA